MVPIQSNPVQFNQMQSNPIQSKTTESNPSQHVYGLTSEDGHNDGPNQESDDDDDDDVDNDGDNDDDGVLAVIVVAGVLDGVAGLAVVVVHRQRVGAI